MKLFKYFTIITIFLSINIRPSNAFSSFFKYPNNPILDVDLLSWDNKYLAQPYVLYGNGFKIWYSGHNGNYWSIGYATSSSIINWNKYQHPVLTSENTSLPANLFTPSLLKENGQYKLWFTN